MGKEIFNIKFGGTLLCWVLHTPENDAQCGVTWF